MPVAHIGLTVSHLPSSCSFFLAALQPLGYRFIGQQGQQIGLGIKDADFFLCQETPGAKAGAAHIALTAKSRAAVRDFYAAALNAGGRPNGAPACRSEDESLFNAAILDHDGNSIEVVFKNAPDFRDDGTVIEHSRVVNYKKRTVTENYLDDKSVASGRSSSQQTLVAPSKAPSVARSISEPVVVQQASAPAEKKNNDGSKQIIGTLLGAAAGAAIAYAMVSSERDSAKKEKEFNASKVANMANMAKSAVTSMTQFAQTAQGSMSQQAPQPVYESQPGYDTASQYAHSQTGSVRAIEQAPSWHGPLYTKAPSTVSERQLDYAHAPGQSVAPSRAPQSEYIAASVAPSNTRSRAPQSEYSRAPQSEYTRGPQSEYSRAPQSEYIPASSVASSKASRYPESKQVEYVPASVAPSKTRSPSKGPSQSRAAELRAIEYAPAPSAAPSRSQFAPPHRSMTTSDMAAAEKARGPASDASASTFVPEKLSRRKTDGGSVVSDRSSRSRSKHQSSRSGRERSHSPSHAPTKTKSRMGSVVGSILGRGNDDSRSVVSNPFGDKHEIDDFSGSDSDDFDAYTVAPSDSISQVSSSHGRRTRRHRSSRDKDGESVASSRQSKHSPSKHHSSSKDHKSSRSSHYTSSKQSDAGTIKSRSRQDSTTDCNNVFDKVEYGNGDMPPVRGITESMVNGGHSSSKDHKSSRSSHYTSSKQSEAGTVKSRNRQDSATDYNDVFDKVEYGNSVDMPPVRGITESMVNGGAPLPSPTSKSMMGSKFAQRLRAFEGK